MSEPKFCVICGASEAEMPTTSVIGATVTFCSRCRERYHAFGYQPTVWLYLGDQLGAISRAITMPKFWGWGPPGHG